MPSLNTESLISQVRQAGSYTDTGKFQFFSLARRMGERTLSQLQHPTAKHKSKYDEEWIYLIALAKKYGLNREEIRNFLKETRDTNTKKH